MPVPTNLAVVIPGPAGRPEPEPIFRDDVFRSEVPLDFVLGPSVRQGIWVSGQPLRGFRNDNRWVFGFASPYGDSE